MSTVEKLEKNTVGFEFSVSAEEFENAIERAYKKIRKQINIPGFRRGKAPRMMIEKMYGKEVFYDDAINDILPSAYEKAIKENNIFPVAQPELDLKEVSAENGVTFTAKVVVKPEFELGTYKGVEVEKVSYPVDDEAINSEIKRMQERNARSLTVDDRAAQLDDIVNIDFEGFKDGVPFDGGKGENYDLKLGSGQFIPGFEDQLVGKSTGEETEVNVTFPEEYHVNELKGQPAVFKVKINEIKALELPELDDEFAKDVSEFDTLDELKNSIKEKLEKANSEREKSELEEKVVDAVAANTEIDIPQEMIDTRVDEMVKDFELQMMYQGVNIENYLKYTGTTRDDMKAQFKDEAASRVKTSLVLEKVCEAEGFDATDEEVEEEYKDIASKGGVGIETAKNYRLFDDVKEEIKIRKTVEFLVANANVK